MLEQHLSELHSGALARIAAAASPEQLEAVRVEVLGRKGTLAQISKEMGKLAARGARPRRQAAERRQAGAGSGARGPPGGSSQTAATAARAWTPSGSTSRCPRPGPRRGHLHPITQIQARDRGPVHLARLHRAGRPRGRDRVPQLRRAEHPAGPPRARHAGHLLARPTATCCAPTPRPCRCAAWRSSGPPLRMIAPGRVFRNEERGRLATSTPSISWKA